MKTPRSHHNSLAELEDYCDGRLPDEAVEPVETHLSECSHCREVARSIAAVDDVFDQWSASLRPSRSVSAAVRRAQRQSRHAARLKRWETRLETERTRTVPWSGAIVRLRVGVDDSQSNSVGGLRISVTTQTNVKRQGRGGVRGAFRTNSPAQRSDIEVFVDNIQSVEDPPLVLLILPDEQFDPMVADLEVLSEQTGVARFKNVNIRDYYTIAVEPVE